MLNNPFKVSEIIYISSNIAILSIKTKDINFKTGQYFSLITEKKITTVYPFIFNNKFSFSFDSSNLYIKPGDSIYLMGPFGNPFIFPDDIDIMIQSDKIFKVLNFTLLKKDIIFTDNINKSIAQFLKYNKTHYTIKSRIPRKRPLLIISERGFILTKKSFNTDETFFLEPMDFNCSAGKCGKCRIGKLFLCIEGPVVDLKDFLDAIRYEKIY